LITYNYVFAGAFQVLVEHINKCLVRHRDDIDVSLRDIDAFNASGGANVAIANALAEDTKVWLRAETRLRLIVGDLCHSQQERLDP